MKKNYSTFVGLVLLLLFVSCKKDNQRMSISEGNYSGTFKVVYPSATKTGAVTLDLSDGSYNCSANPDRFPAGGAGTYTFTEDKISFLDMHFWTADFDWNLILQGEYDYSFDGHHLKIWAGENNVGYYEYDLYKQ